MNQPEIISDLPFPEYNRRQLAELLPERNRERAAKARPAGNFYCNVKTWEPLKYEGFAIVSMLNDNADNGPLAKRLVEIQQELQVNLQPAYAFYQLPPDSFHQTVANTLSNDRFRKNISGAELEDAYPDMVAGAFEAIRCDEESGPLKMKMAGLSIFGTAIGMLGIFEDETDYERVTAFRSAVYNDRQLAALDVKMTRPFIGHITLTYIEHALNKNQRAHLANVINEINAQLANEQLYFNITKTGLRRYYHLAEFTKQDHFPVYSL